MGMYIFRLVFKVKRLKLDVQVFLSTLSQLFYNIIRNTIFPKIVFLQVKEILFLPKIVFLRAAIVGFSYPPYASWIGFVRSKDHMVFFGMFLKSTIN